MREVRRDIAQRKRAAKRTGDDDELVRLDAFSRAFDAAVSSGTTSLARF